MRVSEWGERDGAAALQPSEREGEVWGWLRWVPFARERNILFCKILFILSPFYVGNMRKNLIPDFIQRHISRSITF